MSQPRFRLLSIDGGGIRGLIPALVLAHIEEQTKQPAYQLFDAIAGTSTGGIIALGLAKGVPAADIVALYQREATTIFGESSLRRAAHAQIDKLKRPLSSSWLKPLSNAWTKVLPRLPHHFWPSDVWQPKYEDRDGRALVLSKILGDTPLSAALTKLFITSYETQTRMPVFFVRDAEDTSSSSYHQAICDATMLEAALATSAAPTYFVPHRMPNDNQRLDTKERELCFVDGGIYANNPTGLAHTLLRKGARCNDDLILSLGTGGMTQKYPYGMIEDWGALHWAQPVIKMMFDGQTEATAFALSLRFAEATYVRLQAYLSDPEETVGATDVLDPKVNVSDDLDDTTAANLQQMKLFAARLIDERRAQLDALCGALIAS